MTVTAVHFGTTSVPFTVVNATTITANAPAGLSGAQNVRVTTTHGQSPISAAFTYTAVAAPTITSLSVNTGPAAGGTAVTITGTGFTGATAVNFGAAAATSVVVVSATQITCVSPPGAGGVNVTVVHPTNGTSNGMAWTYAAALVAPVITSANVAAATEGQPFSYTITASGNPAPAIATGFNATGLPGWLTRTNNVVSGTPPAGSGTTSVTFTVTAQNSEGTSPGVLVTVNIAAPTAGWSIDWAGPSVAVITGAAGHIPLTSIPGWNPAWNVDMTEDNLYDRPTMADMPVNLFAQFANNPGVWVGPIHFNNWGPGTAAGNTVQNWGWNDSPPRIEIIASNATSQPVQLRLVKT
jgi:hypothetical protein